MTTAARSNRRGVMYNDSHPKQNRSTGDNAVPGIERD